MANLTETTGDLPQLGQDVGGFLDNLGGPLAKWVLLFVIVGGIGLIFTAIFLYIKKTAMGMGGRK